MGHRVATADVAGGVVEQEVVKKAPRLTQAADCLSTCQGLATYSGITFQMKKYTSLDQLLYAAPHGVQNTLE